MGQWEEVKLRVKPTHCPKGTPRVCWNPFKWCHYSSQQPWKVLSKLIEAWSFLRIVVGSGDRERQNKFTLGKHCRARLVRSDKLPIAKQVLQPTSSEKQPLGCVYESESHFEVKGNLSLLSTHLGQSLASPSQPWRWPSPRAASTLGRYNHFHLDFTRTVGCSHMLSAWAHFLSLSALQ